MATTSNLKCHGALVGALAAEDLEAGALVVEDLEAGASVVEASVAEGLEVGALVTNLGLAAPNPSSMPQLGQAPLQSRSLD